MNVKQKVAIVLGAALLVVSAFYPVWSMREQGVELEIKRRLIYSPGVSFIQEYLKTLHRTQLKKMSLSSLIYLQAKVDYHRMGVEWGVIVLLTIGAAIFFKSPRNGNRAYPTENGGVVDVKKGFLSRLWPHFWAHTGGRLNLQCMDRISLVLAIMAMIPGFLLGYQLMDIGSFRSTTVYDIILAPLFVAIPVSLGVLFVIRIATRLFIWTIGGFKDEKK